MIPRPAPPVKKGAEMNLMDREKTASMEAWQGMGGEAQAELANRAARRAARIARSYGVEIAADELWGETWVGIVKRLDSDYLDRHNSKREQPLTLWQIAYRAAHTAAEVWRYDRNKHGSMAPLEAWTAIDDGDIEARIIDRLTVENFMASRDSRDQAIAWLTVAGHTERQTGQAVGMSGVAVHKRIMRLREGLAEAIA